MHEIELKFQVSRERRSAVDAAVAGRTPQPRIRLQAAYVDTPERLLAQAGLALRVRREGRQWVQTIKGASDDGMTRLEHNVPLGVGVGVGAGTVAPDADPALHAGTPAGDKLLALLDEHPGTVLSVLFGTNILRRTRVQRVATLGTVELAFDEGSILAGDARTGVCELEIELLGGSPMAVIETARRWLPRYGLWLDTRSKAERGDMLARGMVMADARNAAPVTLERELSDRQGWLRVMRVCAEQISVNASQVASGVHGDDHVHQLRIGLRRLRTAMSLFNFVTIDPALGTGAATLFRRLGGARDQVVIEGEFAADLVAALQVAGVPGDAPVAAFEAAADSAEAAVRDAASQVFLLDLLAAFHVIDEADRKTDTDTDTDTDADADADADAAVPLRAAVAKRLSRWHRRAAADAKRYAELDDEGRHRLRKHIKRLRYAVEFTGTLFGHQAVKRYLKPLRALQERLGAINDVVVAMNAFRAARDTDPRAWFALGWLAGRREVLIRAARPELRAFAKSDGFWKKG